MHLIFFLNRMIWNWAKIFLLSEAKQEDITFLFRVRRSTVNYCFHFRYCARRQPGANITKMSYSSLCSFLFVFSFFHYGNHKIIKYFRFLFQIFAWISAVHKFGIWSSIVTKMSSVPSSLCHFCSSLARLQQAEESETHSIRLCKYNETIY